MTGTTVAERTGTTVLAPVLRDLLTRVRVTADATTAWVQDEQVDATSPRELRRLLAEAVYNLAHAGQRHGVVPSRLRDRTREAALRAAVPHDSVTLPVVVREAPSTVDGTDRVLLEREGVRFWAPATVLGEGAADARPGTVLPAGLPPTRPGLSPGFFLVDGSRPRRRGRDVLRVYVHIGDGRHALEVWRAALAHLEEREVPYRAKILTADEIYPRRDALVVYLDGTHADAAPGLAGVLGTLPGLRPETSSFAERLAPGVATAWEPVDPHPGMAGLSFGQHRASVLANAVVDTAGTPEQREAVLLTQLTAARVDPTQPARNLPVPDDGAPAGPPPATSPVRPPP